MEQWTSPDCGTIRISNPKTLQKWIDLGWYKEMINDGYVFNPYCGRFRTENCNCSACRSKRIDKTLLIQILEKCKEKT